MEKLQGENAVLEVFYKTDFGLHKNSEFENHCQQRLFIEQTKMKGRNEARKYEIWGT